MQIQVKHDADYRGEEAPTVFFMKDHRIEVVEVLDRWLSPDHRYFKIKGVMGTFMFSGMTWYPTNGI